MAHFPPGLNHETARRDDRPVQPANLCIHVLETSENFLLLMVRLWAGAADDDVATWREGFCAAGIGEPEQSSFEALLGLQMAVGERALDICGRRQARLSMDEARLLQLVALAQHDCLGEAECVLGSLLPAAAVRLALPHAVDLAAALTRRNLILPVRCSLSNRQPPAAQSYADPGVRRIH